MHTKICVFKSVMLTLSLYLFPSLSRSLTQTGTIYTDLFHTLWLLYMLKESNFQMYDSNKMNIVEVQFIFVIVYNSIELLLLL